MLRLYPAIVHKDPDSDYGVTFPDFPGCVSVGSTLEELYNMAKEALCLAVEGEAELPEPTSLDVSDGVFVMFVPVAIKGKAKRINISMDSHLLNDIDDAATVRGMTRSAFLAEGARRLLDE